MPESAIDTLTPLKGLAVTLSEGVLSVTIDRPGSLNSVTTPVLAGIADAMERTATDPRVKVVRLGGSGRGFCSGVGISARRPGRRRPGDRDHRGGQPSSAGHHRAAAAGCCRRSRTGSRRGCFPGLGMRHRIGF